MSKPKVDPLDEAMVALIAAVKHEIGMDCASDKGCPDILAAIDQAETALSESRAQRKAKKERTR